MNEQKTFDNWHIIIFMNQSRNSLFVDNFVIFFCFEFVVSFVGFVFNQNKKSLIRLFSPKSKCIKILFVQRNEYSVCWWINFQFYWKKNFDSCCNKSKSWKKKWWNNIWKNVLKHDLIKLIVVLIKIIWWKIQSWKLFDEKNNSTLWNKLYIKLFCSNVWIIWN